MVCLSAVAKLEFFGKEGTHVEEKRITSRQNPLISHIRRLISSRAYRREQNLYLGDGAKLLEEAVRWNAPLNTVVASDGVPLPALPSEAAVVRVPEDVMASVSPMKSPQGVLFLGTIPRNDTFSFCGDRYLVLDGVQDPGNVGTIWRTADALGADGLLLTGNCADPWGPKTVRSTMGACFRLPVLELAGDRLLEELEEAKLPLYAAALGKHTRLVGEVDFKRAAVAIGSEGQGLSQFLLDRCAGTVRIPMRPRCESLNAATAAAILLWEMSGRGEGL